MGAQGIVLFDVDERIPLGIADEVVVTVVDDAETLHELPVASRTSDRLGAHRLPPLAK